MFGRIAAMVLTLGLAGGTAVADEGNAEAGAKQFRKCAACHEIGADAKQKVGPILTDIVGRPAASIEGFNYSAALKDAAAGGLVWTEESLSEFLENPRGYLNGTKMSFAGLRKEQDRADIIAYLKSDGS